MSYHSSYDRSVYIYHRTLHSCHFYVKRSTSFDYPNDNFSIHFLRLEFRFVLFIPIGILRKEVGGGDLGSSFLIIKTSYMSDYEDAILVARQS